MSKKLREINLKKLDCSYNVDWVDFKIVGFGISDFIDFLIKKSSDRVSIDSFMEYDEYKLFDEPVKRRFYFKWQRRKKVNVDVWFFSSGKVNYFEVCRVYVPKNNIDDLGYIVKIKIANEILYDIDKMDNLLRFFKSMFKDFNIRFCSLSQFDFCADIYGESVASCGFKIINDDSVDNNVNLSGYDVKKYISTAVAQDGRCVYLNKKMKRKLSLTQRSVIKFYNKDREIEESGKVYQFRSGYKGESVLRFEISFKKYLECEWANKFLDLIGDIVLDIDFWKNREVVVKWLFDNVDIWKSLKTDDVEFVDACFDVQDPFISYLDKSKMSVDKQYKDIKNKIYNARKNRKDIRNNKNRLKSREEFLKWISLLMSVFSSVDIKSVVDKNADVFKDRLLLLDIRLSDRFDNLTAEQDVWIRCLKGLLECKEESFIVNDDDDELFNLF